MKNHELKEFKQRLESLPTLEKRLATLRNVIQEMNRQIDHLLIKFE